VIRSLTYRDLSPPVCSFGLFAPLSALAPLVVEPLGGLVCRAFSAKPWPDELLVPLALFSFLASQRISTHNIIIDDTEFDANSLLLLLRVFRPLSIRGENKTKDSQVAGGKEGGDTHSRLEKDCMEVDDDSLQLTEDQEIEIIDGQMKKSGVPEQSIASFEIEKKKSLFHKIMTNF